MAEETNEQTAEATENFEATGTYSSTGETGSQGGGALTSLWQSLNLTARVGIIAVSVIALGLIILLSVSAATTADKEVLYRRLDPVQAREVAAALDEMGVNYELDHDGTTILVPGDQRDRLRISLSPDLYAQGIGFSLFENGGLVASDFERRVQMQIALEEELRRTITSLDAVDQARVHLVMPEEGVFIRERKEPSASVLLRLSPLTSLSENQVRGILSLVAGSVEGLTPENVSIVDANGNVLYDAFAALEDLSVSSVVENQFQMKRLFETELEQRLRSILEQVYGPGSAVAMVSADMDFDTREQTSIAYDGENAVPRSTHIIREESENIAPPAEEVGEPNIPGQAAVVGGGGDSSYLLEEEIVNYEITETREYIEAAPGQVMRLSTAVMVDNENNDPFLEEQVEQLVASAIGFDEARGDAVTVQIMPFDTTWIEDPVPVTPVEEMPFPVLWLIIGAVVLLLLLLLLFLFLRAKAKRRAEEERELDAMALEQELESRAMEEKEELEPGEAESKAKSIRKLAQEEPESVASLLKTWLAEE